MVERENLPYSKIALNSDIITPKNYIQIYLAGAKLSAISGCSSNKIGGTDKG